jgi:hypothetical protein
VGAGAHYVQRQSIRLGRQAGVLIPGILARLRTLSLVRSAWSRLLRRYRQEDSPGFLRVKYGPEWSRYTAPYILALIAKVQPDGRGFDRDLFKKTRRRGTVLLLVPCNRRLELDLGWCQMQLLSGSCDIVCPCHGTAQYPCQAGPHNSCRERCNHMASASHQSMLGKTSVVHKLTPFLNLPPSPRNRWCLAASRIHRRVSTRVG